ncbi:hypothetical protein G7077_06995 [Sphingomonas piscis]|uniref:Uncharacterized protein n=1 Tax=Sphingomonas piscis TaxID=2714943 RepID=A0A6G7YPL4_9SPHN|nr:hypothetical protein [Sphingomonas piscis]QIK78682.1 hypothetical protein G7077_06995 [Sphingomonas piscis]
MRLMLMLSAAVLLTSCDPPVRHSEAEDIAEDHAEAAAAKVRAQVEELESRVEEIKSKLERSTSDVSALQGQVNHNARIANENARIENEAAAAAMTKRGACGYETVQLENGGTIYRPRQCTIADLKQ